MVAYSCKRQFEGSICSGTKRHTIRGERKRHARKGEILQLYTGMRTRQCRLIGTARCTDIRPITIIFDDTDPRAERVIIAGIRLDDDLDNFARSDGFGSWLELKAFWRANHPRISNQFDGVIISWDNFVAGGQANGR